MPRTNIAGHEVEWAKLDEEKCSAVYQAGTPEFSPFLSEEMAEKMRQLLDMPPGRERSEMLAYTGGAWGTFKDHVPYNAAGWESYHHPGPICGARGCQRACFSHLEEQGKLRNKVHHPFRIRKPWRLDA